MNLRRILVGLDGSPRESIVLDAAQTLASKFDAELILVRAVGPRPEVPPEAWQNPTGSLKEFLEAQASEELVACAQGLPEAVRSRCTLEVVVAAPWEALCLCAQAHQADTIVIGSHGYGAIDRILGSTAARVVNHAACSVIVVRAPTSETPV